MGFNTRQERNWPAELLTEPASNAEEFWQSVQAEEKAECETAGHNQATKAASGA